MANAARVRIAVIDDEPDVLKRIALLNGVFFRVIAGAGLIKVTEADYRGGFLEVIVDEPIIEPRPQGRVSVSYEPYP